jgi:hypothetical protein
MNYISTIRDSIETSVKLKLFKNIDDALHMHILKSKLIKLPLSLFKNVENFNYNRLQKSATLAYPIKDRPRGRKDLDSVKYYQKLIQEKKDILPIWIVKKDNKYILLDGAHRIVSSYIENKKYINSYIIILDKKN